MTAVVFLSLSSRAPLEGPQDWGFQAPHGMGLGLRAGSSSGFGSFTHTALRNPWERQLSLEVAVPKMFQQG